MDVVTAGHTLTSLHSLPLKNFSQQASGELNSAFGRTLSLSHAAGYVLSFVQVFSTPSVDMCHGLAQEVRAVDEVEEVRTVEEVVVVWVQSSIMAQVPPKFFRQHSSPVS